MDVQGELRKAYVTSELTFLCFMVLGLILLSMDSGLGIMEAVISVFFALGGYAADNASDNMGDPVEFLRQAKRARKYILAALVLLVLYLFVFIYLVIEWEGEGAWGFIIFIFFIGMAVHILRKLGPVVHYAKANAASAPPAYMPSPGMTPYPQQFTGPPTMAQPPMSQPQMAPPPAAQGPVVQQPFGQPLTQPLAQPPGQPPGGSPPAMPDHAVPQGGRGGQHEDQQQQ